MKRFEFSWSEEEAARSGFSGWRREVTVSRLNLSRTMKLWPSSECSAGWVIVRRMYPRPRPPASSSHGQPDHSNEVLDSWCRLAVLIGIASLGPTWTSVTRTVGDNEGTQPAVTSRPRPRLKPSHQDSCIGCQAALIAY